MKIKDFIAPIVIALVIGVGAAVAQHDRQIAGLTQKIDAIYEDVKIIKDTLLKKGLE